jgi:hypothetical protein
MARTTKFLLEQIERAKRLSAGLSSAADRERFLKIAADYQKELDDAAAASGDQHPSPATEITSPAPVSEAAPSDAVASESESGPTSIDDQQETKD